MRTALLLLSALSLALATPASVSADGSWPVPEGVPVSQPNVYCDDINKAVCEACEDLPPINAGALDWVEACTERPPSPP